MTTSIEAIIHDQERFTKDAKKTTKSLARMFAPGVVMTTDGIDFHNMKWVATSYLNRMYEKIANSPNEYALIKSAPTTMADIALEFKPILSPYIHIIGRGSSAQWYVWNGRVHELQEGDDAASAITELVSITAVESIDMLIKRAAEMASARQPHDPEELKKMSKEDLGDILQKMGYQGWERKGHSSRMEMILEANSVLTGIESEDYYEMIRGARRNIKDLRDRKMNPLESQLERTLQVAPTVFDSGDRYLVAENGVIDLEDYFSSGKVELREHSPELLVTNRNLVGLAWDESIDMEAINLEDLSEFAPNLELFLCSTDERVGVAKDAPRGESYRADLVGLLTAIGVGVTTDTVLRCLPFLYGASGSGKGMLFRILEEIFSGHYDTAGRAVFTHGKESNKYSAGDVINKKLLINDEIAEAVLDQDGMKDWSGDALIRVQGKNVRDRSVHYKGIIISALNSATDYNNVVNLSDPGMYARYAPVYFPYSYSESADPRAYREPDNENLEDGLRAGELPQLLAVLLRLTRDWKNSEYGRKRIIPLTDHQISLRAKTASGGDHVEAVISAGIDRKLWHEAKEGAPKKELLTFSEFFKYFSSIYFDMYLEKPKHNLILEDMRSKGMVAKNGNSTIVSGLVSGGMWAKRVEDNPYNL